MPKIESIIDFYDVKSLHSKFAFTFHLVLGIKVTKNSASVLTDLKYVSQS